VTATDPAIDLFAKRIANHAKRVEQQADQLVVVAFGIIAERVITKNPLWSGQSKLNWTAAVSRRKPPRRFVNVERKNLRIKKNRIVGRTEGGRSDIVFSQKTANTANKVAISAAIIVSRSYRHPQPPSIDINRPRSTKKPPSIWLSNSLTYAPKLWTGRWRSNPFTLEDIVAEGAHEVRQRGIKLRRV